MKQFLNPLLEPLGMIWFLMLLGSAWLLWRKQWRTLPCLAIPTVLLFLAGSLPLVNAFVAMDESRYAGTVGCWPGKEGARAHEYHGAQEGRLADTISLVTPADAVVVLGGGERISRYDRLGFAVTDQGGRLLTALELLREGKARCLVLGGSWPLPGKPDEPSIIVVQQWVKSWGLAGQDLTNLGICQTTHDEALAFKKLQERRGWKRVMLVTSAFHMKRAKATFSKLGIEIIPVVADFHAWGVPQRPWFNLLPCSDGIHLLSLYLHEKIGWWAYRMRGWA